MRSAVEIFNLIDEILPKSTDIETSAKTILQQVNSIFKNDYGFISIFSRYSTSLDINETYLYKLKFNNIPQIELGKTGLISKAFKTKKIVVLSKNKSTHLQYIGSKLVNDEVVLPLIHQNEVFGVLVLSSTVRNYFKNEDLDNLKIISRIISHILYDKIQHKALLDLAKPLFYREDNIDGVTDGLARKVKHIGKFPVVCVWMLNKDGDDSYIELKGKAGAINDDYGSNKIYKNENGYSWNILNQILHKEINDDPSTQTLEEKLHISVFYNLLTDDSIFLHKAFAKSNRLISVISIPISYNEETYGIINAYSKNVTQFNEDEKLILKNIALSVGIEINNAILRRKEDELRRLLLDQAHFTNAGMVTLSLAHDVKHKLINLKLNIGSLINSMSQNKTLKKFEPIAAESKSIINTLSNLFERLLSYNSRKGSNYKDNNLFDILENIRLMFQSSLDNINLIINCPKEIYVECDFNQLSQVFVNLLKNSIYSLKRISHRHPIVKITAIEIDKEYVQVVFYDNGEGIHLPASDLETIFQITYSTKGEEGSGFGLAICKNIIEDILRGKITVKSEFGAYTQFIIRLPKNKLNDKEKTNK